MRRKEKEEPIQVNSFTALILNGTIKSKGVLGPMKSDIYIPMMNALREEGFRFVHREKSFPTSQVVIGK